MNETNNFASDKNNRFRKAINGKAHQPNHPGYLSDDGTKGPMCEPVPQFLARSGDGIITSAGFKPGLYDNNTMIILGRDRCGIGEYDTKKESNTNSKHDYSDHQGSAAIDIVVGRMAPFPVVQDSYSLGPCFSTRKGITPLKGVKLGKTKPEEKPVYHEGYVMDAARIYMSQMTKLDSNFKISKNLREASDGLALQS